MSNEEGDMLDVIRSTFLDYMSKNGVNIDITGGHPIPDGKMHNVPAIGKGKRNKHAYYVLHADGVPTGVFGDHQLGITGKWRSGDLIKVNENEMREMRMQAMNKAKERADASDRLAKDISSACASLLKAIPLAGAHHPYIVKKGVPPGPLLRECDMDYYAYISEEYGQVRLREGSLVIPMFSGKKKVCGIQTISDDGSKYYVKGISKVGAYCPVFSDKSDPNKFLFICEGWATAATVNHLTGMATVAAFDAGNLSHVAVKFRNEYKDARIIIAADNDKLSTIGDIENPGVHSATLAAMEINASVIYPHFDEGVDGSDYNDLFNSGGYEATLKQIRDSVKKAVDL